jgi:CelD/BcsL family acetyltransferase involved in cellulose biosynthesis
MIDVRKVDFVEIKESWQDLESQGVIPTPFQTYEWMQIWWKHYGQDSKTLLLLAAYKGNILVGVAPLFCDFIALKKVIRIIKVIRFIGSREVDYQGFIVSMQDADEIMHAFWLFLRRHYPDHVIYLCDMPGDSFFWGIGIDQYYKNTVKKDFICPVVLLSADLDDYWASLGWNTKKSLKRYKNKLARRGHLATEKITHYSEEAVTEFFRMHYRRWRMDPSATSLNQLERYEREIIRMLADRGWLRFLFLTLNGRRIAGMLNYDYHGVRYFHKSAFDISFQEYGPGTQLLFETIKDAWDSGLKKFDCMRGEEAYKSHFANSKIQCVKVILAKNTLNVKLFEILMSR